MLVNGKKDAVMLANAQAEEERREKEVKLYKSEMSKEIAYLALRKFAKETNEVIRLSNCFKSRWILLRDFITIDLKSLIEEHFLECRSCLVGT